MTSIIVLILNQNNTKPQQSNVIPYMKHSLSTHTDAKSLFSKVANKIYQELCPRIFLVGKEDDYFRDIASNYLWCEVYLSLPDSIPKDCALIVCNNYNLYLDLISKFGKETFVLLYDNEVEFIAGNTIPVDDRFVCYLADVSGRYLRGHIRILLQLHRYMYKLDKNLPIIISNLEHSSKFNQIVLSLDAGKVVFINTDDSELFLQQFSSYSKYTRYSKISKTNNVLAANNNIDNIFLLDMDLYLEHIDLLEQDNYSCIVICNANSQTECVDVRGIGYSLTDAYLLSYFVSVNHNLSHCMKLSQFIQSGHADILYNANDGLKNFYVACEESFVDGEAKFRNIPPKIKNLSFGMVDLNVLLRILDNSIYSRIFSGSGHVLETSQMLTGVTRSTLQNKVQNISK